MFTVTDSAGAHLAKLLAESGLADDDHRLAVRIYPAQRGLAIAFDESRPDDLSYGYEGSTVLLVEQHLAQVLSDNTLDVANDGQGNSLVLR